MSNEDQSVAGDRSSSAVPPDTSALYGALKGESIEQFLAVYDPAYVDYSGFSSGSLLTLALGNNTPAVRVSIAHRLLDDGADATSHHPLHVLLGRARHDFASEASLLQRLLDRGADINEVIPKFGTPLETIAGTFKFSDCDLTPFYDVLLAHPDLDPLQPGRGERPVLVNLRKWSAKRAMLVERIEAVLAERP